MQKEVLIITGACGVGKTTTAKAWAKAKKGAIIECDYLTEWIFNEDFPQWNEEEEKFTAHVSALMAKEYLNRDLSIAIENVWSPFGINLLFEKLSAIEGITITAVWLRCDRSENHKRDEERVPEDQMKERVDIVNEELESYAWPEFLNILDTTNLNVSEVLSKIKSFAS